jgi:hypothetical protein
VGHARLCEAYRSGFASAQAYGGEVVAFGDGFIPGTKDHPDLFLGLKITPIYSWD